MTQYIQDYLRLTRFIWADKAALVLGLVFSLVLLCLWCLAFLVVGSLGAKHLWGNFGMLGIELVILTVGLAWFAMRTADFFAGGSTYRFFGHSAPKGAD
jgi:uncharacterized membrane protein YhdT